jgi:hypothetical protein
LYQPASPPSTFECLSHHLRGQDRYVLLRHSYGPMATSLEANVDGGDLDL